MKLSDPVTDLKFINSRYAQLLHRVGVFDIGDLLTHFPRYHQDTSVISEIIDINKEGTYTFQGYISGFRSIRLRSKRTLQSAYLSDNTGKIKLLWFNQPYLSKVFDPEYEYLISGKVKLKGNTYDLFPNGYETVRKDEQIHLGRLSPQYRLTAGLSTKWLRNRIKSLIDNIDSIVDLNDEMIEEDMLPLHQALKQIHFPENQHLLESARVRLSITELTSLYLKLLHEKSKKKVIPSPIIKIPQTKIQEFIDKLPFSLTKDQRAAIDEITEDMGNQIPMNRLLEGDVGSGKTIVALIAALSTYLSGYQTVILSPTTVLANQHFHTFGKLLENSRCTISLVTGHSSESVDADIIIGTSAVLARKSKLIKKLGLVVVDEQHRFGVRQREELLNPLDLDLPYQPHLLNMTATPIPRTLVMAVFGDTEVSHIFTKPSGRLPINTHFVPKDKREDSTVWIEKNIRNGARVYWVCPIIEDSETLEVNSAKKIFKKNRETFPNLRIGLLHGKMKNTEKSSVLEQFRNGNLDILVSTSVIEVGVDVPEATIIVIEGAERFGLAQLHQIRGRVGRSNLQSWCLLFTENEEDKTVIDRLEFFAKCQDGLEIAEYDLKLRGPGEVYGYKQSGIPSLKIAEFMNTNHIIKAKSISHKLFAQSVDSISLFN